MFAEREGEIGDSFDITDVWRSEKDDKKYLHIEVTHKKASDEQFEIVWDGRVAESYPLQTWLLVRLNTKGCPDLADVTTDTLSLDLYEFLGDDRSLADERVISMFTMSHPTRIPIMMGRFQVETNI